MKNKKWLVGVLFLISLLTLAACANNEESGQNEEAGQSEESGENEVSTGEENAEGTDSHEGMEHSGSGDVPEGLEEAKNPKFQIDSTATIQAAHMEGMDGAKATIAGAYDTTAYVISYNSADGGERVEGHKWIIHEEIEEAGDEPFLPGDEVKVIASHIKGMKGATAEIVSAEKTTVYMVDYSPAVGGEEITNHKWVTENELEKN
ncbi:Protein of unknown function [Thalassobacillus cyri]|uniref:DUF1541 domain-containing protein n=1 Tax=Thalassobacillus cyri TaxID=571932 RepID=A0A1H3VU39_9BACI|nr:YdhK family protein [Thalassobacillus cyri]SDZ78286.1 Protein of unknown function [Thalassobacillus cyri]